jgi:hypothetical protein
MNFHKKPIYNIAKTLCNGKNKTNFLCAGGGLNMIKDKAGIGTKLTRSDSDSKNIMQKRNRKQSHLPTILTSLPD